MIRSSLFRTRDSMAGLRQYSAEVLFEAQPFGCGAFKQGRQDPLASLLGYVESPPGIVRANPVPATADSQRIREPSWIIQHP
jgi:hypothetical protein